MFLAEGRDLYETPYLQGFWTSPYVVSDPVPIEIDARERSRSIVILEVMPSKAVFRDVLGRMITSPMGFVVVNRKLETTESPAETFNDKTEVRRLTSRSSVLWLTKICVEDS